MLALIAGTGELPTTLVRALPEKPVICALDEFEPDVLTVDEPFRLETLGSLLKRLKARGVTEICMAGGIRRPKVDPAAIDAETMPLVPVIQRALVSGDDGALRGVITILEQFGFTVRAAHDLVPVLLPTADFLTRLEPDTTVEADARRAEEIVAAMAEADIGQACVVRAGQALAIETVFGTDWMLASLAARPDTALGGVFFKAAKPDQDRRVDMPTIGPDTVTAVKAAGLDGIVIEAGSVLVLDRENVIAACDRAGLFLWVRRAGV